MKLRTLAFATAIGLAAAGQAAAHHSFAMFDRTKKVTLEGTIKEFQWTNPHSWVQVMVNDPRGQAVEWSLETGAIRQLANKGWSRDSLKPGDKVVAVIYPRKDGGPGGGLITVTVDGKTLE